MNTLLLASTKLWTSRAVALRAKAGRLLRARALFTAINEAPPALVHLTNAVNAELDGEWLKLKFGVYPNQVGLQVFDRAGAEKMVAAFNSLAERYATLFRGQPIYVGHPDDAEWRRANPGIPEAAVGRITELKIEGDGLLMRRAFNDEGKRLTGGEAPAYTAFSPHWGMEPTTHQGRAAFRPVHLFSVGLCNRPQIPGTFIGLNEALPTETSNPPMNKKLIELLAALGITLAADATEAQATTAINEALPKVTAAVAAQGQLTTATNEAGTAKGQVTTLQSQLTTATNEAATLRTQLAAERSARAEAVLVTAINEGRITAAQKPEWLGKFTAAGADFAAVQGELGKLKKAINTKSQADIGARRGAVNPEQKQRITAINEAITAKMTALGTKDRVVAYNALVAEGHELFVNAKAE